MRTVLLILGSTRTGSTNAAVLNTISALAPERTTTYDRLASLPHFNPDHDVDPLAPEVIALRAQLAAADALLFCTPEYAGALPGSLKNLLDWTVGGTETLGKPAGWVNASGAAAAAAGAHAELATVLSYTGARVVAAACVHVPVARSAIGADELIADTGIRERLVEALMALTAGRTRSRDHSASAEGTSATSLTRALPEH